MINIYLFAVRVIEHAVHDVLGQFGFVRISGSAHPRVNDALIVCTLKWYLQKTCSVTQEPKTGLHSNITKAEGDGGSNHDLEDEAKL